MRRLVVPFFAMLALVGCGSTAEEKCVEACELGCVEVGCEEYCSDYGEGGPCTEEADAAYDCLIDLYEEAEDVCNPPIEPCREAYQQLVACEQSSR